MNIENRYLYTIVKENKAYQKLNKKMYSKINIKRNLKLMNDPAFHQNKTLKEYISNKLNKNISTEKNIVLKGINEANAENHLANDSKLNEYKKIIKRIKEISELMNKNKNTFKKRKIKIKNISSNSKSKTNKMMTKANKIIRRSNTKKNFSLTQYNFNYNNKSSKYKNKIYYNQKLNINNISPGIHNRSNTLNNNDNINRQLFDKRNIFYYSNNKCVNNRLTIDTNLKSFDNNSKKQNILINKFDSINTNINERYNDFTNASDNNIKTHKNNKNNDNADKKNINNLKNNSVIIINTNITNKTDNNTKYYNDFYKISNTNDNLNLSDKMINSYKNFEIKNNKFEAENIKKDNSIEYLKKIEMLENENKLLKGEISESKNRLIVLENKIGKLLGEKFIIEKEECPQPMPYVKKYSAQTCINFHPVDSPIDDNYSKNENENNNTYIKNNEKKNNNYEKKNLTINNNKFKNKCEFIKKKYKAIKNKKVSTQKTSMILSPNKKSFHLKASKSISYLRTRNNTEVQLKVNPSNKSNNNIQNKKMKKNLGKK